MWRRMLALFAVGCAGGSEGDDPGVAAGGAAGDEIVVVNRSILFAREVEGVSDGFDLDGEVSVAGGPTGCGMADFVAPDGTPGIDNAFARMLPTLEATEAQAVESLIQATINAGDLLLMLRLTGVDDPWNDDDVDVEVFRGTGAPLIGSDGRMLASQTFDLDESSVISKATGVALIDGQLEATGLELNLPVQIFDVALDLTLLDANFRLVAPEEEGGAWVGLMGGGVETSIIQSIADEENVDDALSGLVAALLTANADLAPTGLGACEQLSMTFQTEAVESFVYPD